MSKNQDLVTIYVNGDFMGNINKYEGKQVEIGFAKYAQYDNAAKVVFIPKGKRKARGFYKTSHAEVLVLRGVGHPAPDSMYGKASVDANGTSFSQSRYMSFDAGWARDFNGMIDAYLADNPNVEVLMDARVSKGFSPYHASVKVKS